MSIEERTNVSVPPTQNRPGGRRLSGTALFGGHSLAARDQGAEKSRIAVGRIEVELGRRPPQTARGTGVYPAPLSLGDGPSPPAIRARKKAGLRSAE